MVAFTDYQSELVDREPLRTVDEISVASRRYAEMSPVPESILTLGSLLECQTK